MSAVILGNPGLIPAITVGGIQHNILHHGGALSVHIATGGGSGNVLAAGGVTANSTGIVEFGNRNNVSFGLVGRTITASMDVAMTDHTHSDLYILLAHSTDYATSNLANTFLAADHDHGGIANATGQIGGTIDASAWSLSIPDFLLTAAQVSHTHSDLYIPLSESTAYQTSVLGNTFLSTAALSNHTHGGATGINITIGSSSDGVILSVGNYLTTAAALTHVHGPVSLALTNLSGSYSSTNNGLTLSLSADTAAGGNNLTLAGNTIGTLQNMSSGTVTIAGGNNITLSQDGNAFTIVGAASGTDAGIAFSLSSSNTSGTGNLVSSGTIYFEGGNNVTVSQNSNTVKFIGNTPVTSYLGSDATSNFAGTGSSIAGGSMTYNTAGLTISIPAASVTANNAVHAGNNISISTNGVNTTVSAVGLQATSNMSLYVPVSNTTQFLGTAASANFVQTALSSLFQQVSNSSLSLPVGYSTHTHGSLYTATVSGSVITNSSASNGLTLGIPNFATGTVGTHTHGSIYTVSITGTDIKNSSAYSGLTLSIPPYAASSHTHSNLYPALSATTYYLTSNLSNTFLVTSATGNIYFQNGSGVSFGSSTSTGATTVTASVDSGNVYFVNSLGSNITWGSSTNSVSTYIYATAGGGTGGIGGVGSFVLGGNTAGASTVSGSTIQLYGGSNITLSGYSNSVIRVEGAPSGTLSLINSNGVSFGTSVNGHVTSVTASVNAGGGAGGVAIGNTASSFYTSGSVMLSAQNLTVNMSTDTGSRQYVQISAPAIGYLFFSNNVGFSFTSSTSGVSTTIGLSTI